MRKKAAVVGGASQYCDLPGTKCLGRRCSLLLCAFVLATSAHLSFAADTSPPKTVLVLYSFTDRKVQDELEILKSTTRSRVGTPVDFHVEYLGSARFDAPGYEKGVIESLASVYGGKKIDLVIADYYGLPWIIARSYLLARPSSSRLFLRKDLKARSCGQV
jgi:hypothetical protein